MTDDDKRAIEHYAATGEGRDEAVVIYRRLLRQMTDFELYSSTHMNFMREVDAPVPDLMLRARYREQLAG